MSSSTRAAATSNRDRTSLTVNVNAVPEAAATVRQAGDAYQALIASGIFHRTDPGAAADMLDDVQLLSFPAGHVLFNRGDIGDFAYVIVSGRVKLSYPHIDGRAITLAIMGPSDTIDLISMCDPGQRVLTATALTDVQAGPLGREQLLKWISERREIAHQILRLLARRAELTTKWLAELMFADVPHRVAKRLLQLAQRFGRREGDVLRVMHDLTLEELAELAGTDPDDVCKILGGFADRGWLRMDEDAVAILDGESLARVPVRKPRSA